MTRAKKSTKAEKPAFSIRTINVTDNEVAILNRLSRDATDFLGRTVSSSAIVRALVRQIEKHGPSAADDLFFEVERELKAGTVWGKKK
jgi:hypothetical protein